MITAFDIYLIGLVGNLNCGFQLLSVLCFFGTVFLSFAYLMSRDFGDDVTSIVRWLKRLCVGFFVFSALAVITPTTKTIITMYALPTALNNEKVQQLPDVLLDYIIEEFTVKEEK